MTEAEFQTSDVGTAFYNWLSYFRRTIEYDEVSVRGLAVILPMSKLFTLPVVGIFLGQQRWTQAMATRHTSERLASNNYEFHSALVLISSWAAFEAYVDDVCEAMPARSRLSGPKPKTPVENIERQLATVGLKNTVPPDLTDNIIASKLTRNVWTHNAGNANQYFLDNAPTAGSLSVGDTVVVSREALIEFLMGIVTYAVIILNRYRDQQDGLQPVEMWEPPGGEHSNPFKAGADALFPNRISMDALKITDPDLQAKWQDF